MLLHSWAGRLFIVSAAFKVLRRPAAAGPRDPARSSASSAASRPSAWRCRSGIFAWRLFVAVKRQLLWRVRRKLILSYIFFGVIPALLIVGFFLLGGVVLAMSVSAYVFRNGYDKIVDDVQLVGAVGGARERAAPGGESATRCSASGKAHVSATRACRSPSSPRRGPACAASRGGRWDHGAPPASIPDWVLARPGRSSSGPWSWASRMRRARSSWSCARRWRFARPATCSAHVVADLPIDAEIDEPAPGQDDGEVSSVSLLTDASAALTRPGGAADDKAGESLALFRNTVAILDCIDWHDRDGRARHGRAELPPRPALRPPRPRQGVSFGGRALGEAMLLFLVVVAVLFLIIQFVALVMGLALARSITARSTSCSWAPSASAHGDFTHRIHVPTKDQLGELARVVQPDDGEHRRAAADAAEKKRLEEELRIARQIQMSLLPRGPLERAGARDRGAVRAGPRGRRGLLRLLPARRHRLGVLIADVSGKGTSAALYMAELKGAGARRSASIHRVAARAADRGQPDHLGQPRQPQLHHDDLRGARPRRGA